MGNRSKNRNKKTNELVQLQENATCMICGHRILKGSMVKQVSSRARNTEYICPICLMRHKSAYRIKNVDTTETKETNKQLIKRDKNRGMI